MRRRRRLSYLQYRAKRVEESFWDALWEAIRLTLYYMCKAKIDKRVVRKIWRMVG